MRLNPRPETVAWAESVVGPGPGNDGRFERQQVVDILVGHMDTLRDKFVRLTRHGRYPEWIMLEIREAFQEK